MSYVTRAEVEEELLTAHHEGRRQVMDSWEDYCAEQLPTSAYAIQGQLSWYDASARTRWTDPAEAEEYLGPEEPWTLSELARKWLARHVERASPFRAGSLVDPAWLELPSPLFHIGGRVQSDDLAYIDVSRAYWQLYSGFTYDPAVKILPREVLVMRGRIDLDPEEMGWMEPDSRARNGIVGMARMRHRTISRYGTIERVDAGAPTRSPGLWAYIGLILNAVAQEAVDAFGAVQVLTDGYIVPGDRAQSLREHLEDRWRLSSHLEARGPALVTAPGRYRIGTKRTARTSSIPSERTDTISRLNKAQRDCLAKVRRREATD